MSNSSVLSWEQRKLGEVAEIVGGGTPSTNISEYWNGNINWYSPTEIGSQTFVNSSKKKITELGLKESSAKLLPGKKTILFTSRAGIGDMAIMNTDGSTNQGFQSWIVKPDITDIYFLYSLGGNLKKQALRKASGSTFLEISNSEVKKLSLYLPDFKEQTIIGKIIQLIDKIITLQQRKSKQLKLLKKAMLQTLFANKIAPQLRFQGFIDSWKQRKLGEVANILRGASPRPIKDPKWFDSNSKIGWIRISDVTKQHGRIHNLEQHLSKAGQDKTRVVYPPSLLLSIAASVGYPVITYIETGVHDGFVIFDKPKFNVDFMFFKLQQIQKTWNKYGQPGSQVNINSSIVSNTKILIPNNNEQLQISNILKKIEKCIHLQQGKTKKLKNLKQFLLQNMFI
ncbi:restriction endonuclease subunit S [Lactobacillus gasseri]|uniref:restriction endonuclease subunit S n=1 Tax=Lactobacillus gasseri TaxID=1596 RepID=UPI002412A9E0|nr:restriction endonuclease subunit S [Lactobacillus gasseri]